MNTSISLVLRAAAFAADKHRNQRRKDHARTPYINHPLAVARVLAEEGGVKTPEILAAAILHDTLEDTPRPPVLSSSASSEPV
jgi:guanosine-3',5'-bis(diphosphate) 3'-pyrophosphohydrolase